MAFNPMRQSAVLLLAGFGLSFYWFFPTYSADLMATWLAGSFLTSGQPDQVYPAVTDTFLMYPPSQWREFMANEYQYDGPIYPFLYPPIWAKFGQLLENINFWRLTAVALAVNCALLIATIPLAFRATRTQLNPALFSGLALVFLLGTHIGTIALQQNQPQILVSFLMVLTVERMRSNAPIGAALALAIAASIKIYPAFFALFWLFGREQRAFVAFALIGGAIGLASLALAGWPLHRAFLDQVNLISSSVLITGITFNFDAAIAQIFFSDNLFWVPGLELPTPAVPEPGWYSMARPTVWRTLSSLVFGLALILLTYAMRRSRSKTETILLWPAAMIVISLLSPISWAYYFIPAACFAPVLIEKLGTRKGSIILVLSFAPIFGPFVKYYRLTEHIENFPPLIYPIVAAFSLAILAFGFFLAARKESQKL